jgi:hypothetical protein
VSLRIKARASETRAPANNG